jgi:integrase
MQASKISNGRWSVRIPARYTNTGRRQKKIFATKKKAETFISGFQAEKAVHGEAAISAEERAALVVVRQELGDVSLLDVIAHYKSTGRGLIPVTVEEACEAFIARKKAEKLNPATVQDISWRLRQLSRYFAQKKLHELTPSMLDGYLRTKNGWDAKSHLKRLRLLVTWALRERHLLVNPLLELEAVKTPPAKRNLVSPEDLKKLLKAAQHSDPLVLRYLVLSAYGFIRVQEIVRRFPNEPVLCWEDVCLPTKELVVRGEVAKATRRAGGDERFIPLQPLLYSWLYPFIVDDNLTGRIVPINVALFGRRLRAVCAMAGVKLDSNSLRRSCLSYFISAHTDVGVQRVSAFSGNSEGTCRGYYLKLVDAETAKAWEDALRSIM